jgi:hypothetical protein
MSASAAEGTMEMPPQATAQYDKGRRRRYLIVGQMSSMINGSMDVKRVVACLVT